MTQTLGGLPWWMGVVLLAAGGVLFLWALFADRPRGRRRCPKCWYDMTHSPGLRCSECGYETKRERKLLKTRRRWRWAMLGIVMALLVPAWTTVANARENGVWSVVPTTVLIALIPYGEKPAGNPSLGWGISPPGTDVHTALALRIQANELREWQWDYLAWQCARDSRFDFATTIKAPAQWIADSDIPYAFLAGRRGDGNDLPIWLVSQYAIGAYAEPRNHGATPASGVMLHPMHKLGSRPVHEPYGLTLGSLPPGKHTIAIDLSWTIPKKIATGEITSRPVWKQTHYHDITIVPTTKDLMTAQECERVAAALRKDVHLYESPREGGLAAQAIRLPRTGYHALSDDHPFFDENLAIAGTLTFLRDGKPIKVVDLCITCPWWPNVDRERERTSLTPVVLERRILDAEHWPPPMIEIEAGRWLMKFTSDPHIAIHDYDATRYWRGSFNGRLQEHRTAGNRRFFRMK